MNGAIVCLHAEQVSVYLLSVATVVVMYCEMRSVVFLNDRLSGVLKEVET
jgi:hypothetical protein